MKDKIICLIGASGSGKTTIAKELEEIGYNIIHSYTTRKPRHKNEWGHTFIDLTKVSESNIFEFVGIDFTKWNDSPLIAYFNDYEKEEHYFATEEQYQEKGTSIYVVDPEGAEQVKENVKDAEVITIYLQADIQVRKWRIVQDRLLEEVEDRLIKDEEIFKVVKCDYVADANRSIKEVLRSVLEVISNR